MPRLLARLLLTALTVSLLLLLLPAMSPPAAAARLAALDYEVFGRVQGVFFRKFTDKEARRLGLRGWVQNTEHSTVVGQLEGEADSVEQMKAWLQKTGSPQSRIDKAVFKNQRNIEQFSHEKFVIRR